MRRLNVTGTRIAVGRTAGRAIGFATGADGRDPDDGAPIYLPDEAHVLTIAPTGAGKGVSCAVPVLLQYPGPMIVLDPKGELAAVTARRRREFGQKTVVLDPFGVSGMPTASFNPLDFVEPDSVESVDDAVAIAAALMPTQFADRDVFWRDSALQMLTASILHAVTDYPVRSRNLTTVRDIIYRIARNLRPKPEGGVQGPAVLLSRHPEVERLNEIAGFGAPETLGGILHFALRGIDFVRGEPMERSLARSDFTLDEITEGAPMTIYLVVPPHLIPTHGAVLRIWLGTLFAALMRRRRRPALSTLLLLDEAAQLGCFPPLRTAITLLRGYGVQTWTFWQDPDQLAQCYPQDWRTIVNNCRVVQCFGAHGDAAWRDFHRFLGADGGAFDRLDDDAMLIQQDGVARAVTRLDYRTDPGMRCQFDPSPVHDAVSGSLRRPRVVLDGPRRRPPQHADPKARLDGVRTALGTLWQGGSPATSEPVASPAGADSVTASHCRGGTGND